MNQTHDANIRQLIADSLGEKKISKKAQNIIDEISSETISEKTIKLLNRVANGTSKTIAEFEYDAIMELVYETEPKVEQAQYEKGKAWLEKQGRKRKNNPFGYREQEIVDELIYFEFQGFYNAGNRYRDFYTPFYKACSEGNGFQYYVAGGECHIIG